MQGPTAAGRAGAVHPPAPRSHRVAIDGPEALGIPAREREPEMGEIPTVSRFVPQSGAEDDISLDALLDEIIKAGE